MDLFSARIYNVKDELNDFVFPEQSYHGINPDNVSLALSGGGTMAFITSMAMIRFLEKNNMISEISYISTLSGSNWFIAPYIFRELELGNYRDPQNITLDLLENDNVGFAGDVCIDTPVFKYLEDGKENHLLSDKLWEYIVGKSYLEPYNLDSKSITIDAKRKKYFLNNNHLECEIPIEGRPFWISNSSIKTDKGFANLTMTPMYSGIQSRVKINGKRIGESLIETSALDCINPCVSIKKSKIKANLKLNRIFTLNDIISSSSDVFFYYFNSIDEDIYKYTHKKTNIFDTINPSFNSWDLYDNNNSELSIFDGCKVDNLGIVSLVARGCKRILCMCSNLEIDTSLINTNLLPLFGLSEENGDTTDTSNSSQIFRSEDWDSVAEQIERRKESGGVVYLNKKLNVIPNKRLCVKGGFNVELLIYFLYPCTDYLNLLSQDIKDQMIINNSNIIDSNTKNKLENFPTYKTILENKNEIVGYTRIQTNLLYYYTQWCLKVTKKRILNFFHPEDEEI